MVCFLISLAGFWQFFSASAEQRRTGLSTRPMTGLVIGCLFLVGAAIEFIGEMR
jgi:hypothetical protein